MPFRICSTTRTVVIVQDWPPVVVTMITLSDEFSGIS